MCDDEAENGGQSTVLRADGAHRSVDERGPRGGREPGEHEALPETAAAPRTSGETAAGGRTEVGAENDVGVQQRD